MLWKLLWHHVAIFFPEISWWGQLSGISFWWGGLGKANNYVKCAEVRKTPLNVREEKNFFWNTLVPRTFSKQDFLLNWNTRKRLFFPKGKEIFHTGSYVVVWANPKGNLWIQLILMLFPQLDCDCPALPGPGWAQQGLVCLSPLWGLWWCLQSWHRYHYGIPNPSCL